MKISGVSISGCQPRLLAQYASVNPNRGLLLIHLPWVKSGKSTTTLESSPPRAEIQASLQQGKMARPRRSFPEKGPRTGSSRSSSLRAGARI